MHTVLILLLSSFSSLFVGFVWYNPKVFGNIWMRESGVTEEKIKGGNIALTMLMAYVYAFFISVVLWSLVIHQMGANSATVNIKGVDPSILKNYMDAYGTTYRTFGHGAIHGFIAGLFFALPVVGVNALFERRSWKYTLIAGGYWVVTCLLMGGIICQWM
ncbi:DUF1761 domain-containing protein [Flavobacterium sp.]|jgi:hypothetical protein|uniref:DUF1761 domain-containing protein n=1 Tax=Flavobacterium sp. TaxID=239 RepID=UPI0037BE36B1